MTSSPTVLAPISAPEPGVWTELASHAQIEAQRDACQGDAFPIAVKANISVRGFRRSGACPVLDNFPEEADAHVVALLRNAGGVVVGLTNMHELAFGITSANASFGAVRLPGHPDRLAGGSSGGSAAAVARGDVAVALGTDTGGSVSIPASHCGVVGFRPSTGRWPGAGTLGLSTTRDTAGVFTRSVAEAIDIDRIVSSDVTEARPGGKSARLGLPTSLIADLDPATRSAFESAIERLSSDIEFVEVDIDAVLECTRSAEMPLVLWEARRALGEGAARALGLDPASAFERLCVGAASRDVQAILQAELAAPVSDAAYADAQALTAHARERYSQLRTNMQIEGLLFPATPAPAPPVEAGDTVEHLGETVSTFGLYTRNTGPGTVLGTPMVTLPTPVPPGALPVGVTVQGFRFDDRRTLALAAGVEALLSSPIRAKAFRRSR